MLVYFFVPHYPSLFKPYYDAQFAALIEAGHDVRVFAVGSLDRTVNETVTEYGLRDLTRYYAGDELRQLTRHARTIIGAMFDRPRRRVQAAAGIGGPPKRRAMHVARMLTLPAGDPDVCVIHGVPTMRLFPWLRALYPEARIALCYHGGGLWRATAEEIFGSVDLVFTNTEYSVREAVSLGCPQEKLRILPVGFDLDQYRADEPRRYRPHGKLRLISASRFGEEKGHVYAFEALAELRRAGFEDFEYRVIGDGKVEMRALLEKRVCELGLEDRVTFVGSPSTRAVIAALGQADVLLLPSFEYRGIVEMQAACVQEALLMGTLTITTRTGGVPESIPPEMARYSVPCQDVAAIAGALEEIARLDEEELRRLGDAARRWVSDRYDIRRLNDRMLAALEEIPANSVLRSRPKNTAPALYTHVA